jgi:hypothetical protein
LDGLADSAQFELVADANPASLCERFREGDLELSRHLGHGEKIVSIKEIVKDAPLT